MRWLKAFAGYAAPIFLILSPILSYSDQVMSMHRNKSSAGFSLDIPLIMLVASVLKYEFLLAPHRTRLTAVAEYTTGSARTSPPRSSSKPCS